MSAWLRRGLHSVFAVVSITGAAYLWMKYGLSNDDPFSLVNHPLEPWMLDLHVLSSPLFIALFGMVLMSHVLVKLARPGPGRRSGLLALASVAAATLSGYLLQVTTDPGWVRLWLFTHVGSGTLFAASYLVHAVLSLRMVRRHVECEVRSIRVA